MVVERVGYHLDGAHLDGEVAVVADGGLHVLQVEVVGADIGVAFPLDILEVEVALQECRRDVDAANVFVADALVVHGQHSSVEVLEVANDGDDGDGDVDGTHIFTMFVVLEHAELHVARDGGVDTRVVGQCQGYTWDDALCGAGDGALDIVGDVAADAVHVLAARDGGDGPKLMVGHR